MTISLSCRVRSPLFTGKFQEQKAPDSADQAGPSNRTSRSCEPTREEEIGYSEARHHSIESFISHADFEIFKGQYTKALDNIAAFVRNNGDKINPPLTEKTMQSVEDNFRLLKERLFDNNGNTFNPHPEVAGTDRRPLMYRSTKEGFHEFSRLLESEKFSLNDRLNAVVQLAPRAGNCADGIGADLQNTLRQLATSNAGLKGTAHKWKMTMAEAAILEHVKKRHANIDSGMEIHYVTAYFNVFAEKMGAKKRYDSTANHLLRNNRISQNDIKHCVEKVFSKMKPTNAVGDLASEYLGQVQNFLHEEKIDLNHISYDDIQKLQTFQEDNLDAGYDAVAPQVFLKPKDSADLNSAQVFAGKDWPSGTKLHFMKKLQKEGFVDYNQSKILLGRTEEGHIKLILGKTNSGTLDMKDNILWAKEPGCPPEEPSLHSWSRTSPQALFDAIKEAAPENRAAVVNYIVGEVHRLPQNEAQKKEANAILGQWLRHVAGTGEGGLLNVLLKAGVDMNGKDGAGRTALMHAAGTNRIGILDILLKAGADTEAQDNDGRTALMHAAGEGHAEVVQSLLKAGAQRNVTDKDGKTAQVHAAELAASQGDAKAAALRIFIEANTSKKKSTWNRLFGDKNLDSRQKMDAATMTHVVKSGDIDAMKALVDQGVDLHAKDAQGMSPAMLAAENGHADMLQVLIDNGADIDKQDKKGRTPAILAAMNGHAGALQVLIGNGADIDKQDKKGRTPAMFAAANGHTGMLQVLIRNGADIEKTQHGGFTALMYAAENGHANAVHLLLDHDAKIDAKSQVVNLLLSSWGDLLFHTPVMLAAENGHANVLKVLLENGANPNARDGNYYRHGLTPLISAARNGHIEAMRVLIAKGADINAKYEQGRSATALLFAIMNKKYDAVDFLLRAGARVDDLDWRMECMQHIPTELRNRMRQMQGRS